VNKHNQHSVTIIWGKDCEIDEETGEPIEHTYTFNTALSCDAFIWGAQESSGWSRFEIVKCTEKKISLGTYED
jgi:hypothetical protein